MVLSLSAGDQHSSEAHWACWCRSVNQPQNPQCSVPHATDARARLHALVHWVSHVHRVSLETPLTHSTPTQPPHAGLLHYIYENNTVISAGAKSRGASPESFKVI